MTTNKKFISFIAPVYNVNKYLPDFLDSFLQFKHLDFEIILVDDASPENPTKIVKKYLEMLPIKYIKLQKNVGQGFARNEGMLNMCSDSTHFMFIDPDDLILDKEKLIEDSMVDDVIVFNKFIYFDKKETKEKSVWRYKFYAGSGTKPAWGNVYPVKYKSVLFTARTHEDHRWVSEVTSGGYVLENESIIKYRQRKSSTLNENHKSSDKAEQILDHVTELQIAYKQGLIINEEMYWIDLMCAKIEYLYIPKKNRHKTFPIKFSKVAKLVIYLASWLQRFTQFWFFFDLFNKHNKFE